MNRRKGAASLQRLSPKRANFVIEYCKDFDPRRAATMSGYHADTGYVLAKEDEIASAIDDILATRLEASHIDAEWALMEAVDNHLLCRYQGNMSASNTALGLIFKHKMIDALAADKVEVSSTSDIIERLQRGRARNISFM